MRLDVSQPGGDLRPSAAAAREWERIGIGRLWSSETQRDPFLPLAAAIFPGAVNAKLCHLAGEVADGLHVHSFHSPRRRLKPPHCLSGASPL